jgi:hypothetical protein
MNLLLLQLLLVLLCARATHQDEACSGVYVQNLPFSSGMASAKMWSFTDAATVTRQVGASCRALCAGDSTNARRHQWSRQRRLALQVCNSTDLPAAPLASLNSATLLANRQLPQPAPGASVNWQRMVQQEQALVLSLPPGSCSAAGGHASVIAPPLHPPSCASCGSSPHCAIPTVSCPHCRCRSRQHG